jgi:hypothetical protein
MTDDKVQNPNEKKEVGLAFKNLDLGGRILIFGLV